MGLMGLQFGEKSLTMFYLNKCRESAAYQLVNTCRGPPRLPFHQDAGQDPQWPGVRGAGAAMHSQQLQGQRQVVQGEDGDQGGRPEVLH